MRVCYIKKERSKNMKKIGSGKVRDIYEVDSESLMIVISDRISAFDVILPNIIENKGELLNRISEFWFNYTNDIIENHVISTDKRKFPKEFQSPDFEGRSMLVKKLKMLPIECIVRGYISGSGWTNYQTDGTICGIKLPKGLKESQKLPEAIFTPSTKAEEGHDINISFEETTKLLGEDLANKVKQKTIEVYNKCADFALSKGIIIADTKVEFGINQNGELILADELLTPDSSRFWSANNYKVGQSQQSFDKQYLRDWLKNNKWDEHHPTNIPKEVLVETRNKYIEAYVQITGETFNK